MKRTLWELFSSSGALVSLDGSGSSDPDGDPLTYTWTGPFGTATGVNPIVTLPLGGPHTVALIVNDSTVDSAPDTVDITVVDTIAPTLTLLGANPLTLECHINTYSEPGATATDACDGDVSGSIVIDASGVDTSTPGNYSVTYNVSDSSGNAAAEVIRTVNVFDTTPPTITLLGANPVTLECHIDSYTESGATATDACEGDISTSIVIDASAVNTSTPGSYPVTYNVSDSAGNAAVEVTRTVNVVDTTPPTITLLGGNPLTVECATSYTDPGADVSDDCDANPQLVIDDSNVNTAALGTYTVNFTASDAAGNQATATRTVNIVDTTPPMITLNGDNPLTLECNIDTYSEPGATANDACEGDVSGSILIDAGGVDTSTPGSYPVTYNVSDSSGNAAVEVTRTVNVVDTTPPTITLKRR